MTSIIFFTCCFLFSAKAESQVFENSVSKVHSIDGKSNVQQLPGSAKDRVNLLIFTRERKGKIDLLAFYTFERARIVSLFHLKNFYLVNARSSKNATVKVDRILGKKRKLIERLWFDSHGHGNRYSSFLNGTDQYSYRNIHDTTSITYLRSLAMYCDEKTKIGLGFGFAVADFYFPATDSTTATRMNGDSLMMGLSGIFSKSTIYASETSVMTKPGTFTKSFWFCRLAYTEKI